MEGGEKEEHSGGGEKVVSVLVVGEEVISSRLGLTFSFLVWGRLGFSLRENG